MRPPSLRSAIDFRSLRYFLCVAESRSFSKAADLLLVAQPALSRAIRKLESELAATLFLRTPTGVELTDAGALLFQRAQMLLRQLAQTADDVRAQHSSVAGTVTIGLPPATGELLMPPVVRRCAADHPHVRLRIVEGFSATIYDRLVNQELALALLHSPILHASLTIEPLLIEPMCLIGPPARKRGLPAASTKLDIARLPMILPGPTHRLRLQLERGLAEQGRRLGTILEVEGLETTKALVAAGHGYTLLLSGAVHREVARRQLTAVRLREPAIDWTMSFVFRSEQGGGRALALVRRIIRAELHRLVDSGAWPGNPRYAPAERAADSS